jgi:antitoxin (DNA-binding transcriptional repressor) of toxin-antitoxin stability system
LRNKVKRMTVSDLRYRLCEVERLLLEGSRIEVTKSGRVIARMLPVRPKSPSVWPDFLGRLRTIYGEQVLNTSAAERLAQERERF